MDEISYKESYFGIFTHLNDTTNSVWIYPIFEKDSVSNVEWILGSNYSDVITGTSGNNRIRGDAGNDRLIGL